MCELERRRKVERNGGNVAKTGGEGIEIEEEEEEEMEEEEDEEEEEEEEEASRE